MDAVVSGHPVGDMDKHHLMLKNTILPLKDPDIKFDVPWNFLGSLHFSVCVCACVYLRFKYQSTTRKMIMGKTGQGEAKDKENITSPMRMQLPTS